MLQTKHIKSAKLRGRRLFCMAGMAVEKVGVGIRPPFPYNIQYTHDIIYIYIYIYMLLIYIYFYIYIKDMFPKSFQAPKWLKQLASPTSQVTGEFGTEPSTSFFSLLHRLHLGPSQGCSYGLPKDDML